MSHLNTDQRNFQSAMESAVRLQIADIQRVGGPSPEDVSRATSLSKELAHHGDKLLFPDAKSGETAEMFDKTAHAIAVVALAFGEITIFGSRFEGISTL